jgi:hypothetical protein
VNDTDIQSDAGGMQGPATPAARIDAAIEEASDAFVMRSFFTQGPMHLDAILSSVNLNCGTSAKSDLYLYPYLYRTGVRCVIDGNSGRSIDLPDDYPVLDTEPLRKLRDLR